MAILFFSSIYPHYYAWWSYFNYYNDDFYSQCWHQLFFTVTEMVSTVLVLHLVDKNNFAAPRKIVIIMRLDDSCWRHEKIPNVEIPITLG